MPTRSDDLTGSKKMLPYSLLAFFDNIFRRSTKSHRTYQVFVSSACCPKKVIAGLRSKVKPSGGLKNKSNIVFASAAVGKHKPNADFFEKTHDASHHPRLCVVPHLVADPCPLQFDVLTFVNFTAPLRDLPFCRWRVSGNHDAYAFRFLKKTECYLSPLWPCPHVVLRDRNFASIF